MIVIERDGHRGIGTTIGIMEGTGKTIVNATAIPIILQHEKQSPF